MDAFFEVFKNYEENLNKNKSNFQNVPELWLF